MQQARTECAQRHVQRLAAALTVVLEALARIGGSAGEARQCDPKLTHRCLCCGSRTALVILDIIKAGQAQGAVRELLAVAPLHTAPAPTWWGPVVHL